jgi:hypothetical protein
LASASRQATPFHPEHAFGAQSFAGAATYLVNQVQADDLAAKGPGYIGGPQLLADVTQYLTELRDETWKRQDSAMSQQTIAGEVRELLIARHPDWDGQEWIEPGVGCLCAEHAA